MKMLELPDCISFTQEAIEVRTFEENDWIVKPGDSDDCAYVVLEGSLTAFISVNVIYSMFKLSTLSAVREQGNCCQENRGRNQFLQYAFSPRHLNGGALKI